MSTSNIIYNKKMVEQINYEFSKNAVPVPGTDCTEWKGSYTGCGTAQIFFSGVEDSPGDYIMARTVAQCVHYLETGEDLNNTDFFLSRTCQHQGCTNPNHYEKKKYKEEKNNKPKITIIPKWQLRKTGFDEIKDTYYSLDNVSYLSKKYNIDRTLVRKIMNNKAVLTK